MFDNDTKDDQNSEDQKKSEQENMAALLENVPGGIVMYEWNGKQLKTLYTSGYYTKLYGKSPQSQLDNLHRLDFPRVHPDDVKGFKDAIRTTLMSTHQMEYVYRIWSEADDKYLWAKMNAISEVQKNGNSLCYVMYSDITRQQEAVEREKRLSKCLELMTNDENVEENLETVMKLVEEQYMAERVYIFEFDWKNQIMSNTYEYVAEGVTEEKENLQDLPIDMISHWMEEFKRGNSVFLDSLEAIRDIPERRAEYEVLKPQGIYQLMVIPIIKNNQLFGYVGVDNPHIRTLDKEFLTSVAHILSQEFFSREQQRKLLELSLRDPLTKLNNRHSYNMCVDRFDCKNSKGIGVIFADVNGLKYMNDNFGHREGDKLICLAAQILVDQFSDKKCFRISGDEFVVIDDGVEKCAFFEKAEKMKQKVLEIYGSVFSIGMEWQSGSPNLSEMVTKAEERMYVNKELYYKENPLKKRRNMLEIINAQPNALCKRWGE